MNFVEHVPSALQTQREPIDETSEVEEPRRVPRKFAPPSIPSDDSSVDEPRNANTQRLVSCRNLA